MVVRMPARLNLSLYPTCRHKGPSAGDDADVHVRTPNGMYKHRPPGGIPRHTTDNVQLQDLNARLHHPHWPSQLGQHSGLFIGTAHSDRHITWQPKLGRCESFTTSKGRCARFVGAQPRPAHRSTFSKMISLQAMKLRTQSSVSKSAACAFRRLRLCADGQPRIGQANMLQRVMRPHPDHM